MTEVTASKWRDKLSVVGKQTREMLDPVKAFVRCSCNKKLWPHQSFRCLYCGEWYCQKCAEIHFGKTVEQYRVENPIVDDPEPLCSGFKILPSGSECKGCNDCLT